jgi:hypothetical protein
MFYQENRRRGGKRGAFQRPLAIPREAKNRAISLAYHLLHPSCRGGGFVDREEIMIRKLKSGQYRLLSRKMDPKTGKHRNLGTFDSLDRAKQHERQVQFFKRQH